MCKTRRELSNAYLLAKFGFDTAENELIRFTSEPASRERDPRGATRGPPPLRALQAAAGGPSELPPYAAARREDAVSPRR